MYEQLLEFVLELICVNRKNTELKCLIFTYFISIYTSINMIWKQVLCIFQISSQRLQLFYDMLDFTCNWCSACRIHCLVKRCEYGEVSLLQSLQLLIAAIHHAKDPMYLEKYGTEWPGDTRCILLTYYYVVAEPHFLFYILFCSKLPLPQIETCILFT